MLSPIRRRDQKVRGASPRLRTASIESLESRTFLSATLQPNISILHSVASSNSIEGFTPSQIRKAYGFDQIALPNGAAADGSGQTIAIVDAFNDSNIAADLKVFDQQFGLLDPPSFHVVNQTGGTTLPRTDSGWAGEISLDVEWAHAMAPAANILLVEAKSDSIDDLMTAVNYARHAAGVSVVSVSWGGSEYFSWGRGESQSQTSYDSYFTTPSGHQGITFVASAGDSGSFSGVQWPASSPNVLSVGGTSLYLQSDGTYGSETAWSGTSGGYSKLESEPAWQQSVQSTGKRSSPDVAYDADPNTGCAVYDSIPDQGTSGWSEVAGTSAGAPQWAAIVAIADQGRAISGLTTLDGATQTMSILYGLYSATGTGTTSTYSADFNDVTSGGGGGYRWRFGGSGRSSSQAAAGYDTITGLGTPKAAAIVTALVGSAGSAATAGSGNNSSTSSGTASSATVPQQALAASPIAVTIISSPVGNVIGGSNGLIKVRLINISGHAFEGPAQIQIYASSDTTSSSEDQLLTTLSIPVLRLRDGASKVVTIRFAEPSDLNQGAYYFIASASATAPNTSASQATSAVSVVISPPVVDLSVAPGGLSIVPVVSGKGSTVTVTIRNLGNVTASGSLNLSVYGSSDTTLDASDSLLGSLSGVRLKLRPGRSIRLRLHFTVPLTFQPGSDNLIASIQSATSVGDTDSSNDVTVFRTVAG